MTVGLVIVALGAFVLGWAVALLVVLWPGDHPEPPEPEEDPWEWIELPPWEERRAVALAQELLEEARRKT